MLIVAKVTHRWQEGTLIVPTAAEEIVDGLLDELDGGPVSFEDTGAFDDVDVD